MKTQFRFLDSLIVLSFVLLGIAFLSSYTTLTNRLNNLSEIVDLKEKEIHELKLQDNHLGDKIASLENSIHLLGKFAGEKYDEQEKVLKLHRRCIDQLYEVVRAEQEVNKQNSRKIVALEQELMALTIQFAKSENKSNRDWKYLLNETRYLRDDVFAIEEALKRWDAWWLEYEPGIVRKD